MGRYRKEFAMRGTPEQMYEEICGYLFSKGYQEVVYKGEKLLKKPDNFTTGPIFFKVSFFPGGMRLESWMKRAFLPGGAYVGEIAPEDFQGWAVKGAWKDCIGHIEAMFMTDEPAGGAVSAPVPAPQTQDNFCTACGAPLKPGAAFCGRCGQRI